MKRFLLFYICTRKRKEKLKMSKIILDTRPNRINLTCDATIVTYNITRDRKRIQKEQIIRKTFRTMFTLLLLNEGITDAYNITFYQKDGLDLQVTVYLPYKINKNDLPPAMNYGYYTFKFHRCKFQQNPPVHYITKQDDITKEINLLDELLLKTITIYETYMVDILSPSDYINQLNELHEHVNYINVINNSENPIYCQDISLSIYNISNRMSYLQAYPSVIECLEFYKPIR